MYNILTLGVHAQRGLGWPHSVCVSVTTLAKASLGWIGVGVFIVFTVMLLLLSSYKLFHRYIKARMFSCPFQTIFYAAHIGVDNNYC